MSSDLIWGIILVSPMAIITVGYIAIMFIDLARGQKWALWAFLSFLLIAMSFWGATLLGRAL